MKIVVTTPDHKIRLDLPTGLIFSRGNALLLQKVVKKYAPEISIPDGALPALCAELRRMKKKYGAYPLVEVETASGEQVCITL